MPDVPADHGRGRRITVKDLARQLGISVATVSRAFHEDAVIAAETREKVLLHAAEIGYQPNPLARGLVTKSSRIVGIVASDITNPFYPEALDRLSEQIQSIDFNVMLVVTNKSRKQEDAVRVLLSYHPDVVILLATTLVSMASNACRKVGTPVICFNRRATDAYSFTVTCDNELGGRMVADHLIDRGHRQLAFVAGRPDASTNVDRWRGFSTRCVERGLSPPRVMGGQTFSYEDGYAAALQLLNTPDRPQALFCANDILAIGAMDAARRDLGMTIPEDVSIVGFDDISIASWHSYALTTVRQPLGAMLELTTELLRGMTRGDVGPPTLQQVPGELIERNTTRFVDGK